MQFDNFSTKLDSVMLELKNIKIENEKIKSENNRLSEEVVIVKSIIDEIEQSRKRIRKLIYLKLTELTHLYLNVVL